MEPLSPAAKRPRLDLPKKVLLVGEADFSFARLYCQRHPRYQVVATEYAKRKVVALRYPPRAFANLEALRRSRVPTLFEVDATRLKASLADQGAPIKYDKIIFNFPHTGSRDKGSSTAQLVANFLKSAREVLLPNGRVVMTLVDTASYDGTYSLHSAMLQAGMTDAKAPMRFDKSGYYLRGGYRHIATMRAQTLEKYDGASSRRVSLTPSPTPIDPFVAFQRAIQRGEQIARKRKGKIQTRLGKLHPHEICLHILLEEVQRQEVFAQRKDEEAMGIFSNWLDNTMCELNDPGRFAYLVALRAAALPEGVVGHHDDWMHFVNESWELDWKKLTPAQYRLYINGGCTLHEDYLSEVIDSMTPDHAMVLIRYGVTPTPDAFFKAIKPGYDAVVIALFTALEPEHKTQAMVHFLLRCSLGNGPTKAMDQLLDHMDNADRLLDVALVAPHPAVLALVVPHCHDQERLHAALEECLVRGETDAAHILSANLAAVNTELIDAALVGKGCLLPLLRRQTADGNQLRDAAERRLKKCPRQERARLRTAFGQLHTEGLIKPSKWRRIQQIASTPPGWSHPTMVLYEDGHMMGKLDRAVERCDAGRVGEILTQVPPEQARRLVAGNYMSEAMGGLIMDGEETAALEIASALVDHGCDPVPGLQLAYEHDMYKLLDFLLKSAYAHLATLQGRDRYAYQRSILKAQGKCIARLSETGGWDDVAAAILRLYWPIPAETRPLVLDHLKEYDFAEQ